MLLLPVVATALAACDAEPDEVPEGEWCRQTGYAIANRTFSCEGDEELANERYERLMDDYACLGNGDLSCARRTLELTCEQVAEAGDDIGRWLALASCGAFALKGTPEAGTDG